MNVMLSPAERDLVRQEHQGDPEGLCLVCGDQSPCPVVRLLDELVRYTDALAPFAMLGLAAREGWENRVALIPVPDPMGFFAQALDLLGDEATLRYATWYRQTEGGRRKRPKSR